VRCLEILDEICAGSVVHSNGHAVKAAGENRRQLGLRAIVPPEEPRAGRMEVTVRAES
jgi:hypothetical protein